MGGLSVRDDLRGDGQEAALKDLLSTVADLGEADTDEVSPFSSEVTPDRSIYG